jgi:hypothetical protein
MLNSPDCIRGILKTMSQALTATAPAAPRWPRVLLFIAALIELSQGLGSLPILAGNLDEIPGPGLGGKIIIASIILQPLAATAALIFLVRDRLPAALISMAFVILAGWLSFLPSIRLHGLELQDQNGALTGDLFSTAGLVWEIVINPALALAVAALVLAGKRLTLASVLAVLPTLVSIAMVVAFGISIAIYGF